MFIYLNASLDQWKTAAQMALGIYFILLAWLAITRHMKINTEWSAASAWCVDGRLNPPTYRVPGGLGALTFGVVPAFLGSFFDMPWLYSLARIQFCMSCVDWLILMIQYLFTMWRGGGMATITLKSHSGGCGRLSAWDPIGGIFYVLQIILVTFLKMQGLKKPLEVARDVVAYPYTLAGFVIIWIVVTIPGLLLGKFTIPSLVLERVHNH